MGRLRTSCCRGCVKPAVPNPSPTPTLVPQPPPTSILFVAGRNSANYNSNADWNNLNGNVTTVGSNGGPSAYGTYDQSGNVYEWNDLTGSTGSSRGIRGGDWQLPEFYLLSSVGYPKGPSFEDFNIGFRLASRFSTLNPLNLSYFVNVADINNVSDANGYGSVGYVYSIGQYPVTNSEYAEFLNKVAVTDSYGLYNLGMGSDDRSGINRSGSSGSYSYSVKANMGNKPVIYVSWFDCARYCNWLHNGKPTGAQNNSTTEDGAYTLNGAISGDAVARNASAKYHIPTENEWYKAAYYDPRLNDGTGGYWNYATQSNTGPVAVTANNTGDGMIGSDLANISLYTYNATAPLFPSPTPSPTITSSRTPTPTITITRTTTSTPTNTPTNTPTTTITSTPTSTPKASQSQTPTNTPTRTLTPTTTPTLTPSASKTIPNDMVLFDKESWSFLVPEPFRTYLDQASDRWSQYLKYNTAAFEFLSSYYGGDWHGLALKFDAFAIGDFGLDYFIAACGPATILEIDKSGSKLLANSVYFQLIINRSFKDFYSPADWVEILTHELGHALGIGVYWGLMDIKPVNNFLDGSIYTASQTAYNSIVGSNYNKIPLEIEGDSGTQNSHWENNPRDGYPGLSNELMVGYYDPLVGPYKLSSLSIKHLVESGYVEINPGASEGVPSVLKSGTIQSMSEQAKHLSCKEFLNSISVNSIGLFDLDTKKFISYET